MMPVKTVKDLERELREFEFGRVVKFSSTKEKVEKIKSLYSNSYVIVGPEADDANKNKMILTFLYRKIPGEMKYA